MLTADIRNLCIRVEQCQSGVVSSDLLNIYTRLYYLQTIFFTCHLSTYFCCRWCRSLERMLCPNLYDDVIHEVTRFVCTV